MAGNTDRVTEPPQKSFIWRGSAIATLAIIASGCGMVDYDIGRKSSLTGEIERKRLGAIHVHFSEGQAPTTFTVRRVNKGYAIQSPIYASEDGTQQLDFVTSRTSTMKGFIGVQGKISF